MTIFTMSLLLKMLTWKKRLQSVNLYRNTSYNLRRKEEVNPPTRLMVISSGRAASEGGVV